MFSVIAGIIPLSLRNGGHLIPFANFAPLVCKCVGGGATALSAPRLRRLCIIGHFGDESFQSITCTDTDNLTRTTNRQNTLITQNNTTQKRPFL